MPLPAIPVYFIAIGMLFPSWDSLKAGVQDWAVGEHFSFMVYKKDQTRVDYRCRERTSGCLWRVYATGSGDEVEVRIVEGHHTCAGANEVPRDVHNSQSWLLRSVPQHLFVTKETEIREIIECMQMHFNVRVTREAARLARAALINDRKEHQREQFHRIPVYISLLERSNPGVYTNLETIHADNTVFTFQRIFIYPSESRSSFAHMRQFLAVDGTFLKSHFVQTLLLVAGIDANGHNLLLAWAVVESGNKSSWAWFMQNLKDSLLPLDNTEITLISDRDKDLLAADEILGPNIIRLICCFHLKGNLIKRYSGGLAQYFWPIANAKTIAEYEFHMMALRQINGMAAEYLESIDTTLWVTAFYRGKHYGHKTSNVVESVNNILKGDRELSILDMLSEIWHKTMHQRFERYTKACQQLEANQDLTDFALKTLLENRQWAQKNTVRMGSQTRGVVMRTNNKFYSVDLQERTCDCGHFQENGIPCGHAFSCIFQLGGRPRDYVPATFSTVIWRDTYATNLVPINLADLVENEE